MQFVLTGFGEFSGVKDNPTTHLMNSLPSYLATHPVESTSFTVLSCTVLETSGVGSLEVLKGLHAQAATTGLRTCFVHFGVDSKAKSFRLESTAYNMADFRCADQRGWQPVKEKIVSQASDSLCSALPVDALVAALQAEKFNVETSTDPGRFVCNWVYFHSLVHCQQPISAGAVADDCTSCLFVHVPPHAVHDLDAQLT